MKLNKTKVTLVAAMVGLTVSMTGCAPLEDAANDLTGSKSAPVGDASPAITNVSNTTPVDPASQSELLEKLDSLKVSNPGSMKGYSRDRFPHWEDASTKFGWPEEVSACNARWATLWYSGDKLTWEDKSECAMLIGKGGGWTDQYGILEDGKVTYKTSKDPQDFDIDHIVAIADAWRSGASELDSDDDRAKIANDPLNLAVSNLSANRSKGDQSPADYLPPGNFRCDYSSRYVQVKSKYDLSLSQADKDRLKETIQECDF